MKTCKKCGAQLPDTQVFCSSCGAPLEEKKDVLSTATSAVKQYGQDAKTNIDGYFGDQKAGRNDLEKFYKAHGGLIIGILAIAAAWWYWDVLGLLFGVLGIYVCKYETSQTLKVVGYACGGLAVALSILSFLL